MADHYSHRCFFVFHLPEAKKQNKTTTIEKDTTVAAVIPDQNGQNDDDQVCKDVGVHNGDVDSDRPRPSGAQTVSLNSTILAEYFVFF